MKLDVRSGGNSTIGIGMDSSNDASLEIGASATGNHNAFIDLVSDTTYTDWGIRIIRGNAGPNSENHIATRGTGVLLLKTVEAGPIAFKTTDIERMRIDPMGNVGIGTTSPLNKVHITDASAGSGQLLLDNATNVKLWFSAHTDGYGAIDAFNQNNSAKLNLALSPWGGNVGIGTPTPFSPLEVNKFLSGGTPATSGTADSNVLSRLRSNVVGFDAGVMANGNIWLQNRNVTDFSVNYPLLLNPNGGNVGIGTTNPTARLYVADTSGAMFFDGSGSSNNFVLNNTSGGRQYSFRNRTDGRFDLRDDTSGGERISVNASGSVGIGTTNPDAPLTVHGVTHIGNDLVLNRTDGFGQASIVLDNTTTTALNLAKQGGGNLNNVNVYAATTYLSGSVGIGTTNPSTILDINGEITVKAGTGGQGLRVTARTSDDFSWAPLVFDHNGGYAGGLAFTPLAANISVGPSLTNVMTWMPSGNVGIGTSAPASTLHVRPAADNAQHLRLDNASGTAVFTVGTPSTGDGFAQVKDSAGTAKVYLHSSASSYFNGGSVGIGTTSPTEKLHIYGSGTALKLEDPGTSNSQRVRLRISGDNLVVENLRSNDTVESTPLTIGIPWSNSSSFTIGQVANANFVVNRTTQFNSSVSFGDADSTIYSPSDGMMQFKTDGVSNLYLKASGGANLKAGIGAGNTSPSSTLHVYDATSTTGVTRLLIQEGAGQSTSEAFGVYANDGITPRMVVKNGNVGIGTTSPTSLLNVKNNDGITRSPMMLELTNTVGNAVIGFPYSSSIQNGYDGFSAAANGSTFNFGGANIGFSGYNLNLGGSNDNVLIRTGGSAGHTLTLQSPGDTIFNTYQSGWVPIVILKSSGNVGIGTASPGSPLTVNGTVELLGGGIKFPDGTVQTTSASSCGGMKAWVLIDGPTGNILSSCGISSVNRPGSGTYTVTLSSVLADTNYIVLATARGDAATNWNFVAEEYPGFTRTTTQFQVKVLNASTWSAGDPTSVSVMVNR